MSSEMVELPLPAAEAPVRLMPRGITSTTAGGAAR